jgi:hypothetical protein
MDEEILLDRLLELIGVSAPDWLGEDVETGSPVLVDIGLVLSKETGDELIKDDEVTSSDDDDSPSEVDKEPSEGSASSQLVKTMARKAVKRIECFMT